MWAIAGRELRSYFLSPLAWVILAILQFILGLLFAVQVEMFLQPELQADLTRMANPPGLTELVVGHLFVWVGIIMMLVTPLLTMRLISEERRQRTLPLLLSAPVPIYGIILGKYLGMMGFFTLMLMMVCLMPLSLLLGGTLDYGQFLASILGVWLLMAAFTAVGLYISTLAGHPTLAAIGTFAVLLFMWIADWLGQAEGADGGVFTYIAMTTHYQALLKGVFDTENLLYYLIVITVFLVLSVHQLDSERI